MRRTVLIAILVGGGCGALAAVALAATGAGALTGALTGVAVTAAVTALLLQILLVDPARVLASATRLVIEAKPDARLVPPPALAPLGDAMATLQTALARLETQRRADVAREVARVASAKDRLEAVLRDLSDGVLICSLDHRISLYNQAALTLLHVSGEIGLGRSLATLLDPADLQRALDDLRAGAGGVVAFAAAPRVGPPIAARMTLLDGGAGGYVLTLACEQGPDVAIPQRPEFYDFDLLSVSGPIGGRRLRDLVYVVFDTETTGLRPSAGDEIVSIAAARICQGRVLSGETFSRLVNPGRPIPPESTKFHGITDEMVRTAPSAAIALKQFHAFVEDAVLVAHNAAFDMSFLKLKQDAAGVRFDHVVLDSLLLSAFLFPDIADHSLDAVAARLGIDIAGRHSALGDAVATATIFAKLIELAEARGLGTLDELMRASRMTAEIRAREHHF